MNVIITTAFCAVCEIQSTKMSSTLCKLVSVMVVVTQNLIHSDSLISHQTSRTITAMFPTQTSRMPNGDNIIVPMLILALIVTITLSFVVITVLALVLCKSKSSCL